MSKVALAIIINRINCKIAIVNQNHNSWSLPKGHVDPGETYLEAAIREAYEETGLKRLHLLFEVGQYERYRIGKNGGEDQSELKTIIAFMFETDEMKLHPIDSSNPEARWVHISEATFLLTHEKDKEFLLAQQTQIESHIEQIRTDQKT